MQAPQIITTLTLDQAQTILPNNSQKKKLIQHRDEQTKLMNLIQDRPASASARHDGLEVHHAILVLLQEDLEYEWSRVIAVVPCG